jgi:hypothetical protein
MRDILQGATNVVTDGVTIAGDPNPTLIVSHPDKDHYNYIKTLMDGSNRTPAKIYLGGDYNRYLGFRDWLFNQYSTNDVPINNRSHSNNSAVKSWANNSGEINPNLFQSCRANLNLLTVNNDGIAASKSNRNSAVLQITYKHKGDKFYSAIFPGDTEGKVGRSSRTEEAAKSRLANGTASYENSSFLVPNVGSTGIGEPCLWIH